MIALAKRSWATNAPLLLTLTTLFWAGNMIVGRWIAGQVPPVTLAFLRWTGATALIAPFAWRHLVDAWPTIRAHLPLLTVLGVAGSGLFNTLQYIALVHTTTTSAGIIYASGPVLIMLMSCAINGERISALQVAGIMVSLAGVLTVITHGDIANLAGWDLNLGDLLMLAAVSIWAFYTALLTKRPAMNPIAFAAVTFAIAALLNLPLSVIELARGATLHLTPATTLAVLYTAVFPSLVSYLFYNRGVEIAGPSKAGAYINLVPLFAAVMAMIFLGERPGLYHAIGFALILAGVALATRGR